MFSVQPLAVALLWLPATINQTHVFPQPVATINNAETRDLGLRHVGLYDAPLRSRVCGVSLFAYDQGTMRTLLTVADI